MRALPDGVVTFLLTDIEGSSALFRELGPRWEAVLARHNEALRTAVSTHGGIELKSGGDGFIFVFTDPTAAIAAAIDGQLAVRDVRVRMGIHAGEAKVVDDDYVSFALHQAARVMSAANGGQIIASPVVAAASLPDLAAAEDLGAFHVRDFDGATHLHAIRHPDLGTVDTPVRAPSAVVHNLPPLRTSFVGRGYELGELTKLVRTSALVTVVGTGGVGKTRLAAEAGRAAAGDFEGGVWLVALQNVRDGRLVVPTIADALGLQPQPGHDTFDLLLAHLQTPTLLLLDNCEHLIDDVADVCDRLLAAADVHIVATSREPLQIDGEHMLRLGPMNDVAATDLFVQRAQQVDASFVTDDTVERICRELDGIPLALELVAARVGSMPLEAIADGVLDASRRGGDARQRSIRNTIDWSYQALARDEQRVVAWVSVFRGGFTADAAALVCAADDVALGGLVSRSLLELDPTAEPPRYRVLEPIRDYANEQLVERGDVSAAESAHVDWIVSLLRAPATTAEAIAVLAELHRERDNVLAAIDAALRMDRREDLVKLIDHMNEYWKYHVRHREGIDTIDRVLALDWEPTQRADLLRMLGTLQAFIRDHQAAERSLEEAERLMGPDHLGRGDLWHAQGRLALLDGRFERALEKLAAAKGAFEAIGKTLPAGYCASEIAEVHLQRRDAAAARPLLEEGLAVARASAEPTLFARCAGVLADIAHHEGDLDAAIALSSETLDVLEAADAHAWTVTPRSTLARALLEKGDLAAAHDAFTHNADVTRDHPDAGARAFVTSDTGVIPLLEGRFDEAERAFHDALSLLDGVDNDHWLAAYVNRFALLAFHRGDDERATRYWAALHGGLDRGDFPPIWDPWSREAIAQLKVRFGRFDTIWADAATVPIADVIAEIRAGR